MSMCCAPNVHHMRCSEPLPTMHAQHQRPQLDLLRKLCRQLLAKGSPNSEKGSMSICCAPKVHHTRRSEPSPMCTVSTGASGLRVRIAASWRLVGLPALSDARH